MRATAYLLPTICATTFRLCFVRLEFSTMTVKCQWNLVAVFMEKYKDFRGNPFLFTDLKYLFLCGRIYLDGVIL